MKQNRRFMKDKIILMLKGMIIGVANIIPGVSGGTLMIILGLYEDVINTISHFFKKFKKNIKFIIPIAIGMVVSILLLSKVISVCLDKYPFPTTLFFVGLIIGGLPLLWNKSKAAKGKWSNWLVFIITFGVVLTFAFLKSGDFVVDLNNLTPVGYITLFLIGMVSAATMVIPGISGSFVLMLLGYYKEIVSTVGDLTNFSHLGHNLIILIPFGIGVLLGIFLITRIIKKLLEKYETKVYFGVLGFVIASIIGIVLSIEPFKVTVWNILIGVVTFIWGFLVTRALMKENKE